MQPQRQRTLDMKWRFIYRGLKARYRDQRTELKALIRGLSPNQVAIDVGSNKGSYLWSLSRALPMGRVIAFEPQPVLANYLREACLATGLSNVTIEGMGCSIATTSLRLAIPGTNESSAGASFEAAVSNREDCRFIEVTVISLDDYFLNEKSKIGALKIDVEGHELAVLKGASKLIKKHKPTIVCECEQRHMTKDSVKDVIDFVQSLNYSGILVTKKGSIPASEFNPSQHQKQIGERYWDAPDYYNNFVFKPL
jgi:FkbM family methyltransferase